MTTYRSTMLRLLHDEHGSCPVCQFIAGERNPAVLLLVIERLDARLAETERMRDLFCEKWTEAVTAGGT